MQTDEMSAGQAKMEATSDQPEWYELLDSAREEIMDATHMLLDYPRTIKGGRMVSMSPTRRQAVAMLEAAVESIKKAMEQV